VDVSPLPIVAELLVEQEAVKVVWVALVLALMVVLVVPMAVSCWLEEVAATIHRKGVTDQLTICLR